MTTIGIQYPVVGGSVMDFGAGARFPTSTPYEILAFSDKAVGALAMAEYQAAHDAGDATAWDVVAEKYGHREGVTRRIFEPTAVGA